MQIKKTLQKIYVLIIVVMAVATVIGKYTGLDYVSNNIFGAWWFSLLWAVGTALGIVYFVKQKVRRPIIVLLHLSFVVILAGALLTHLTAKRGTIHLRQGKATTTYTNLEGGNGELPFTLLLNKFSVSYHAGNMAAMDYASNVTVSKDESKSQHNISMNNIYTGYGVRLCQSSYDDDMKGSYLSVNSDPYGIPVTYTGYALLFFSLVAMLTEPKGNFRHLLRTNAVKGTVSLLLLLVGTAAKAQTALPKAAADEFGKVLIVYNGRICPVETYAIDFTKKLYGKASYKKFTPCQVLTGFLFWRQEWMREPILRIKGSELRTKLRLNEYIAPISLFAQQGYILGPYLQDAQGEQDEIAKQYIRSILSLAGQLAVQDKVGMLNDLIFKLRKYQYRYGGSTVPSRTEIGAERIYNSFQFATVLFIVNLTLGLLSIFFLARPRRYALFTWLMGLSWCVLTFTLALRWIINGTIPIANGYETMLLLSWLIMIVSIATTRKLQIMTTFGLLASGFMLLVSHLGEMDPGITPRMPVLNSPLLSIHVSIIMVSYALLSLTFVCAVAYFCTRRSTKANIVQINSQLTTLSQIFLYPAITTLGLGIFIGAIWANISWGNYWGWDPKETWALITFMIYAIPLHSYSLPQFRKPDKYHLFMFLAFLSILMTYFGVNYILGGMHSYA